MATKKVAYRVTENLSYKTELKGQFPEDSYAFHLIARINNQNYEAMVLVPKTEEDWSSYIDDLRRAVRDVELNAEASSSPTK